jgi:hypothetical protein
MDYTQEILLLVSSLLVWIPTVVPMVPGPDTGRYYVDPYWSVFTLTRSPHSMSTQMLTFGVYRIFYLFLKFLYTLCFIFFQ